MKISGLSLILVAPLALAGMAASQNTSSSVTSVPSTSLTINAVKDPVKIGTPVLIQVTFTNKSDHDISFLRDVQGRECEIDVRDAGGNLPPDTHLGYLLNGHVPKNQMSMSVQDVGLLFSSVIQSTVKVGGLLDWKINVSSRDALSKPGAYTIQVQRQDPGATAPLLLTSNKITVTVIP